MKSVCLNSKKIARVVGFSTPLSFLFGLAGNAFAQTATPGASKGGTTGALPDAGSTELTYLLFIGGVALFVFGMLKLVLSWRE